MIVAESCRVDKMAGEGTIVNGVNRGVRAAELASLPGGTIVAEGIEDLERGQRTIAALLVSIGAPRLERLGFPIAAPIPSPEHR